MPSDPPIKRRRILVSDLDTDSFKKKGDKIATTPPFQLIAHGADPNALGTDPKNGTMAIANNGTNITKIWAWNGTIWLGN